MDFKLIEKEIIPSLKFNNKLPVNQHPDLLKQIKKATILGNSHRRKVGIFFKDDKGVKKVETTIWASGKKFICLKGGVWVPIDRLLEVRIQ
ncbi:MAG: hypothetical protein P8I93_03690 [Crocinitomicaceae bacterium]|nr:hypothetical protein [Crocinitomicaceae bacterium]